MRMILNPFYVYIACFCIVLTSYSLEWSRLYPLLQEEMVMFLLVTFLFAFLFGKYFKTRRIKSNNYKILNGKQPNLRKCLIVLFLLFLALLAEMVYDGYSVPLGTVLGLTNGSNYKQFGIPTFHVLYITFKDVFALLTFYFYCVFDRKRYLYISLLTLFINIMIVNRADLLWNIIAMYVIFVSVKGYKKVSKRFFVKVGVAFLILLYLFGVMGNYRSQYVFTGIYSSDFIESVGQASNAFKDSIIPGEFFWSYLYISSPLANLQHTADIVGSYAADNFDITDFFMTIFYAGTPDAIAKRILPLLFSNQLPYTELLDDRLTVCTMYNTAIALMGYLGGIVQFFVFSIFIFVMYRIFEKKETQSICLGILTIISIFSIFSNMVVNTGWIFQLVWLFLYSYFPSIKKIIFF